MDVNYMKLRILLFRISHRTLLFVFIIVALLSSLSPQLPEISPIARAINECDKYAIDKGSIFTDSKICADPCEEPATPVGAPITPGSVFVVGDSIGVGVTPPLGTALPASEGWSVAGDSLGGRSLSSGISVVRPTPPEGLKSAKIVLVILGTNNLTSGSNSTDISTMVGAIQSANSNAKIYWLKTNVTRADLSGKTEAYNTLLTQNTAITSLENTATISSDGIHPKDYPALANQVASSIKGSTQASTDTNSAQELAKQMLANTNITFWTNNNVNSRDIIVALSEGKKAYTTTGDIPRTEVDINVNILKFILEVGQSNKVMVNALTDKDHSSTSNHYKGLSVDLDNNGSNSPPVSVLDPIAAKYGGKRNNETTHWHYDFTSAAATSTPVETKPAASCCSATSSPSNSGAVTPGPVDLKGFVDEYGQMAFDTSKKYGLPYEAVLAQGYLESRSSKGPGLSQLAKEAFNFWGMKAGSSWNGPVWTGKTQEEYNPGELTTITDSFRSYPNAQAGFDGYGEFVHKNTRYKNALNYPGDPVLYITEIKAAGWATDSEYVSKNVRLQKQVIEALNGKFPPSSEVKHDSAPPNPTGQEPGTSGDCNKDSTQPSGSGGTPEANKAIAQAILTQQGLPASEMICLDKLWTRESGWNHRAINDAEGNNDTNKNRLVDYDKGEDISETESDAYGIPQSLPGGKMKASGEDWRTNPTTQMNWGLGYIKDRYSTPCGAWNHSENVGWY